jgi:hypothetical protein
MLLTRSLPPQFLLPAWSRLWLAIANERQQRVYTSSLDKRGRHKRAERVSGTVTEDRSELQERYFRTQNRGTLRAPSDSTTKDDAEIPAPPHPSQTERPPTYWNVIPPRYDHNPLSSPTSPQASAPPLRILHERAREKGLQELQNSQPLKDIPIEPYPVRVQAKFPLETPTVNQTREPISSASAEPIKHAKAEGGAEKSRQTLRKSEQLQRHNNSIEPKSSSQEPGGSTRSATWTTPPSESRMASSQSGAEVRSRSWMVFEQPDVVTQQSETETPLETLPMYSTPQSDSMFKRPGSQTKNTNRRSLFEELFPEDTKESTRKEKERKSDKLPSFAWQMERQREKRRQKALRPQTSRSIPLYKENAPSPLESTVDLRKQRREASVLVLNCAPSSLAESDFFRLGPKGNHIQGWTSGIIKGNVIHLYKVEAN